MGKVQESKLTPITASVIDNQRLAKPENAKDLKKAIRAELEQRLRSGEISKADFKDALHYVDNKLAKALVRESKVEGTAFGYEMYGFEDLDDPKADKLMKESGLNIGDLYDASRFAGADYEVSYTHLNKSERKMAENGEITSSELKNIQNALNAKIKENGGEKILNEKETKQLMEGLGLSVENKFNVPKIIMSALGLGYVGTIGGVVGLADVTTSTSSVVSHPAQNVTITKTTTNKLGWTGVGIGTGIGMAIGAGAEMIREAHRKEKPYGEQGGAEGGEGSATNRVEAKVHEVGIMHTEAIESGEYQPLPSEPPIDPLDEFFNQKK